MSKVTIVAQDPSFRNWGLIAATLDLSKPDFDINISEMLVVDKSQTDDSKKKQVRKNSQDLERAQVIHNAVDSFLERHNPTMTFVEVPHGSQSAASMKGYGVCIGILGGMKTPMVQLSESECKIAAVGKRIATKKEMISWAMDKHPAAPWKMKKLKGEMVSVDGYNEHLADACAALEAGLVSNQFINALAFLKVA